MRFLRALHLLLLLLLCVVSVLNMEQEPETRAKKKKNNKTWRNCLEVQQAKGRKSGIYSIFPYGCCPEKKVQVYCDLDTDDGGWAVIQRRMDSVEQRDFYRTWMEYALGFGDLEGEFWLGLDHIHALTSQTSFEIRFDLSDFDGQTVYAKYNFFYVHDRENLYTVEVNGYSGTAGNSFEGHNKMNFSAKDADYDIAGSSCAQTYKGAWWYRGCHGCNLNGYYYGGEHDSYADGVNWQGFRGYYYSLNFTEMKIRPSTY